MSVVSQASATVTALSWVPDFAKGQVRDLRVRWALEEAGIDYSTRLLDPRQPKPDDYLRLQPWGQVPAFRDGDVSLFESGAIVLHIAEGSETLMPRDPQGRATAISWLLAALNSVEPAVLQLGTIDVFARDEPWAPQARPYMLARVRDRLSGLARHLSGRQWLDERFTVGDLMVAAVLRQLDGKGILEEFPDVAAHKARCLARPAFQRALTAQLDDFEAEPAAA